MAEEESKRVATISPEAAKDFSDNQEYTTKFWGWAQAQRYSDFLQRAIEEILEDPDQGKSLESCTNAKAVYVKWPRAKHGHYIVYREVQGGIYVLRILHGAMDVASHLSTD